jgi:dienelactone hydrolase/protein-tyrosine-phosphatase
MEKIKVLFVCMGNICRSPTAEGVFAKLIAEKKLASQFTLDSAGTHAYHVGNPPDERAQEAALKRGVELKHLRARKVHSSDFEYFDYVLAMDDDNYAILIDACPKEHRGKIKYFLDYAPHLGIREVPDPYYGEKLGFDRVLDMVEEASLGFLKALQKNKPDNTGQVTENSLDIIEKTVVYLDRGVVLEGFFAFDGNISGRRPAVLISHAWGGRDAFVADKARKIAKLGYVGFALDMYGKGVLGANKEENATLMQPFMEDRQKLQQRMQAALNTVKHLSCVDNRKIAVMGFCFGGLCALDLARTSADIKGVVSFHGLLGAPGNTKAKKIKAKILALHGCDDPMVPLEQVLAFQEEMTQAGADWQFVTYGNTVHAFTNPIAKDTGFGTVYNASADRRSWQAMQNFLAEIFG